MNTSTSTANRAFNKTARRTRNREPRQILKKLQHLMWWYMWKQFFFTSLKSSKCKYKRQQHKPQQRELHVPPLLPREEAWSESGCLWRAGGAGGADYIQINSGYTLYVGILPWYPTGSGEEKLQYHIMFWRQGERVVRLEPRLIFDWQQDWMWFRRWCMCYYEQEN